MLSYFPNHSKHSKTTKVIKLRWIASIWRQNDKKCWVTLKPFQTQQNYKSDQITMNCIDLTSKRSKMLSYVPNHSKHSKTTKVIKSRWIASIWRQNDQKFWVTSQTIPNTAKLQKWSNHDELHRFDVKTIKNVELRSNHSKLSKTTKVLKSRWIATIWRQNDQKCSVTFKPFQTQQNYKSDLITMNCIDLTSKRSKMFSHVQTIPNTAKLQKWSNYDENDKKCWVTFKPFQTQQNYKSDQITMNCIDLTSKR